jgi:branched-chain amino acid transport system permease protein
VSLALQVLVTGLAAGGVYGLVAVGHSVIYRLTGIVHLAYGDLVGLGVFATLLVAAGTGPVTQKTAETGRFVIALAVGLAICIGAGVGSYLFAVQP